MPELRTAPDLLAEARKLTERDTFPREAEAKFKAIMQLYDATRAGYTGISLLARKAQAEMFARTIDPATLAFFRGQQFNEGKAVSVSGGLIERQYNSTIGGRPGGAVTVLRDYSSILENRTYAGLTTAQGGTDGGSTIPIGFIPAVFAAMKRTDQILEAANWDTCETTDGRVTNLPSLTDTSTSAVKIAEAAPQTFANPSAFANLQWPSATTWTSQVIKASVQLDQDAGVKLAALLADAFRIRFARGFGAECVSILLGDVPVGATAESATIDEFDLLNLMGSVDSAYAASDSAGWAMNFATFLSVIKTISTTGEGTSAAAYVLPKDDQGHYLLFGKKVLISPSMPDIAFSPSPSMPILFGDWSRFLIRHVPTEAVIRRYDELFLANMQVGYEMLFRGDAKVMHAGGSGDDPIKALVM